MTGTDLEIREPAAKWGRWAVPAWLAIFLLIVTLLQLSIPYPLDDDTAYHFSVARLVADHGALKVFPWTRFSWQFDHYADKEFLFHLLFVPFIGLGFIGASRVVGVICGVLVLAVLYLLLRSERVRYAGIWALLPFGASIFVYRFAQVRPQLLSIALALIILWSYARGRVWILALAALLYPLSYVAFWQIPLIIVVAVEASRRLSGERFRWQPPAALFGSIVLGTVLHPNSLHLLEINWIHMADILFKNAWGDRVQFNMGEEFEPFPVAVWLRYLLITLSMAVAALVLAWRERRSSSIALAYTLAMLIFGLLTIRTNRFLEYFVPLSVLALAVATREIGERKLLAPGVLAGSLFYTAAFGITPFSNLTSFQLKNWYMEPEVAVYFSEQIPKGSNVFTCGWEYTGSLLLNLPDRNYMVALDPTLMYKRDPGLYDIWYRTLLNAPVDSAEIVRSKFNSRFVVCQNYEPLWPFFDAIAADPGVRTLFANDKWLLFDLGKQPPVATQGMKRSDS